MQPLPADAALVIIDVQNGFDEPRWGTRNNLDAETKITLLLDSWRRSGRPVVHVQHMSLEPDSPLRPNQQGNDFKTEVTPLAGEHVEQKTVNSAFIGTGLEQYLRGISCTTLVLVGLTTDHCVSTTTRMAGNLGFKTYVVADATATFNREGFDGAQYAAKETHAIALASLHGEFAHVLLTAEVLEACSAPAPQSVR